MPIFEYRCAACQTTSEKITSQPPLEIPCPSCGQPAKKAISVFSTTSGSPGAYGGGGSAPACGSGFT